MGGIFGANENVCQVGYARMHSDQYCEHFGVLGRFEAPPASDRVRETVRLRNAINYVYDSQEIDLKLVCLATQHAARIQGR